MEGRGGEGFGNFPPKKSCTENNGWKQNRARGVLGKKKLNAVLYLIFFSIFILKRTLAQAITQQKNHAQIFAQTHLKKVTVRP